MGVNLFSLCLVDLREYDGWELKFKLTFTAFCVSSVGLRCDHMNPVTQNLNLLVAHHLLIELNYLIMKLLCIQKLTPFRLERTHFEVVFAQIVKNIFHLRQTSSQIVSDLSLSHFQGWLELVDDLDPFV